jgi:cephalosporin-C deacetylase-like acetyl esterase
MRCSKSGSRIRFFILGGVLLALSACGGSSNDDDDGRIRAQQSGVFIDSPVSGLDYNTATRSGSTGNAGVPGSFAYLQDENITFSLDCITLGTVPGQLVISPRTLLSGQAATNLSRLLLSLDADGNNTNGIEVGSIVCPAGLGTINFDLPPADFASQSPAFEDFIEDNASDNIDSFAYQGCELNDDLVCPTYADDHLTCSLQGGVYFGGVCSNAPTISINDVSALEGNSGTSELTFTVTLSRTSLQQVQVNYATAENSPVSAMEGTDYQAASGTLTFPPNSTSQTFSVTLNGDTTPEPDETFLVNLSAASNGIIGDGQGTGTITNDDGAAGTPQLGITPAVTVAEGASGATTPANFTVTLTNPPASGDVTVQVQTADDTSVPVAQRATANADYAAIAPAQTLTLNAANTTRVVTVNVNGDNDVESDERFAVRLSGATGATITSDTGIGTITDDDVAPVVPELSINDVTLSEGNTGTNSFTFVVTLSPNTTPVSVSYATANGSTSPATGGAACNAVTDYVSGTDSVSFPTSAVAQTRTITVAVCGDFLIEPNETFFVNLTAPDGVTVLDAQGLGTINNDDAPLFLVGAASRSISPSQDQVNGQTEDYLGGTRQQFFHLGGFGFGPFKLVPGLGGALPELVFGNDPIPISNPPVGEPCFATALTQGTRGYEPSACDGANGDHTWVRAFVIEAPDNPDDRVVFISMDAVGAGNLIQDGMKAAVNAASCAAGACIEPDNILIGQTHTHAGADLQGLWGGVPRDWIEQVLNQAAADAVTEALNERKAADVVMARGHTGDFNSYRRPKLRGDEEVDLAMTLLQARAADGSGVIGTIMQYAAHPTSIGGGDFNTGNGVVRVPHPDYPLGAEEDLEAAFGGTALYFNGPIADASASGGPGGATPYDSVKNRGDAMATRARSFLAANAVPIDPVLSVQHAEVILPITNPLFIAVAGLGAFNGYYQFSQIPRDDIPGLDQIPDDQFQQIEDAQNQLPQLAPIARTLVSRISLGTAGDSATDRNRLEIVTLPGEATNTFGQYIRRLAQEDAASVAAPKRGTMLLGLTQNSFGYIIPEEEFSYFDPSGEAGFIAPFTGYEEFVSLGPLTAPLLRTQGYNVLFGASPEQNIPPSILACINDPASDQCLLNVLQLRVQQLLEGLGDITGLFAEGLEAVADGCREFGGPDEVCGVFDTLADALGDVGGIPGVPGAPGAGDPALLPEAIKAIVQGCDMLDPAHCLFPFPSDHFTVAAAPGSPQAKNEADPELGGTGKRVNFNILAMPRNIAGKPIDPREWNRNDGFSPGAMVMTYVPNLGTVKDAQGNATGPVTGAVPLTALDRYEDENAPIVVIDADTGERHPVWAEIDLNAGKLLPSMDVASPKPAMPALIIRPATNFIEGHRYVVALRNLVDQSGNPIAAGAAFTVCRDELDTLLPPLQQRCAALDADGGVFDVLDDAGIDREDLYLAWDFTVASARNQTSRLVHMRDDAFRNVLGDQEDADGNILSFGRAPAFTITEVRDSGINSGLARVVRGTFTIPSYMIPADASPLDGQSELRAQLQDLAAQAPDELNDLLDQCDDVDPTGILCGFLDPDDAVDLAASGSLPPNRLLYNPADGLNPSDPEGSLYGDGLPDRNPTGEMTATFTCNIPKKAVEAGPGQGNARPSLYGHGLLGGQGEGGIGGGGGPVTAMGGDHNMMFCATDWFGFATGDVPNVLTVLLDLSLFPVVPDAGQQGALNFMFLARLMSHPNGFANDPAFQISGSDARPVFDRREVFYDGNSQGGILGGPVIAVSKDVNRGVLGVPAQNYSTLLARSVDFDLYSVPLYLAYPDDLDRNLGFGLIQMLWDRSENNGYTQNMTRASLGGPANQILLHPAFADHQVSHWAAQVMARTIGVEVADMYPRRLSECGGNVQFCYADGFAGKQAFFDERDPDETAFWDLPLVGRLMSGGSYDSPATDCSLAEMMLGQCGRNTKSAFVEFDKGETVTPPIGNVPPRGDGFDPHSFPRATAFGQCQKSHFLHTQGRVIDVRDTRNVVTAADCPAVPAAVGTPLEGGDPASNSVSLCAPDAIPGIGGQCIEVSSLPLIGPVLATLLNGVDGVTETVADACRTSPLAPACVVTDSVAQLIQQGTDTPPVDNGNNASCATGANTTGNRSYQVKLGSESGETISFQVLEPATFNCAMRASGAHPLILQGHGFGGSRSTSGFADYRNAGFAVISIDQRGFGQSSGTVRTMDPDFEGKDLVQILDWAEENLDYLAYRDEDKFNKPFVPRPADGESESGGINLVVGAIGGSYGGGFQFLLHNVDEKDRLDALAPDITWHDLRYSLNPGDTLKSAFGLLLSVGGTQGSYAPALQNQEVPANRGLDPFILETLARAVATGEFPRESLEWFRYHSPTYWCDLRNEPVRPYDFAEWDVDPNTMLGSLLGEAPGSNRRANQTPVDILLSQGFRDNLFNFNEAWWNYQCARVRGGDDADVRLITHQSGHILNLGGLTGQDLPPGTPLDVQTPGTTNNCGGVTRTPATVAWFNEKLRPGAVNAALLDDTDNNTLCLSLSDDDAVFVPEANMLAPRAQQFGDLINNNAEPAYYQIGGVGAASVPQGVLALTLHNAGQLSPSVVPLLNVGDANGLIVAGIPQATITVKTPAGINDAVCAATPTQLPSLRTGCDSVIYVGLGKKSGSGAWALIDDQLTPVRGLGEKIVEMVGVGERLAQGDELALLIYGYHPQYIASYSRDVSIPVVNVEADLKLPLYVVGANQQPSFNAPVAGAVNGIATGTGCTDPSYTGVDPSCIATGAGANVVRQLCDYQFLPGVCEQFANPDPGYNPEAGAQGQGFAAAVAGYDDTITQGPLQLMVGAVHEHSGYSDGDPTAIPRDYFRAGRTGVNQPGKGVKLDFMFSSEHSDNEKVPVTTSAACIPFSEDFIENPDEVAESDPTSLVNLLSCSHASESHHYFKWQATLQQAMAETERDDTGAYTGFTGTRGFEWTNDYYNHMNVYFSTNVVNTKVDGSFVSMEFMWNWLRKPVAEGGGADALLSFNHPGGDPSLSPFDGGQPHNQLLAQTKGGSNWNDLEYIPDVDRNVVAIEVNGGDDLQWYIKALNKGWHLGPLANEDEHGRNWSSHDQGKTLILTRGRSPQDYYYAFQNRRTVSVREEAISGVQGAKAQFPQVLLWANDLSAQKGEPMGSILRGTNPATLRVLASGLPAGAHFALVGRRAGQPILIPLTDNIAEDDQFTTVGTSVPGATTGEDWYFLAACKASQTVCGSSQDYGDYYAVTAPIWLGPGDLRERADVCVGGLCVSDIPVLGPYLLIALQELDKALNQVASACTSNLGDTPLGAVCAATDTLASLIIDDGVGGAVPPVAFDTASCAADRHLDRGASYQVKIPSADGKETISFQVLEPTSDIQCANGVGVPGEHPLLLQGHGFGGSRSTSGFDNYRGAGYTVISIDQRGFGNSSGTVRTMDPDYEGQDLLTILDWAETNLDYLSYRNELAGGGGAFVQRPANGVSQAGGINLVVGAIGGSYGGGYQLLITMVDGKKRLDALQPDITWHDLRFSLNPGDTTKSLWDLALSGAGEGASQANGPANGTTPDRQGLDPFIKETLVRGASTNEFPRQALDWFRYHSLSHWCEASGLPFMPYPAYGEDAVPLLDPTDGDNTPSRQMLSGRPGVGALNVPADADAATHLSGLDVLLTQGMPDTLFNFNEAWWNYQCLSAAGAQVSLTTHTGGHAIPYGQAPEGLETPVGGAGCSTDVLAWFNSKLKPGLGDVTPDNVCFVLADGDTVNIDPDAVLAPQPAVDQTGGEAEGFTERAVATAVPVPNGLFGGAQAEGVLPIPVSLGTVAQEGVLAGLPFLDVTVSTPGGVNESAQDCGDPMVPIVRIGCDSIVFAGLGIKRAGAPTPTFELIDDQLLPLRGLGRHTVDMVGVAERLLPGDEIALLLFSNHIQFFGAYSRDASIPAVNVNGSVRLPIYAVDGAGDPVPGNDAAPVLQPEVPVANLQACYTHPTRDDCLLKPLAELLSINQRNACFTQGFSDADCPISAVLNPITGNDPSGATEQLTQIVSDVVGCSVQPKSPFCQFSADDCDIDPTGQACAIQDVLAVVYGLNNQLGLPVTGPEAGDTVCDQPAGEAEPGSLEFQQRDLLNILCSAQRLTDQYANPDFHLALSARTTPRTLTYSILEQAAEPTRPRATLEQLVPGARSTDPYRLDEDWAFAGRGRVDQISFIAESGSRLVGRVFRPPASIAPPYPLIVVTTGSIQGYQEMYNWAYEGLAEAGYMVLSYDVQGQGRSETLAHSNDGMIDPAGPGVPFQQAYNFVQGTRDAMRWALSSRSTPYIAPSGNTAGTELYNPFSAEVDRTRVGLAGHSLGASAVSQVAQEQACDPLQPRAARNGCVSAVVGWDALSAPPAGTAIKAPGLSLSAEYFLNPTPAQDAPDAESGLGAFNAYGAANVDSMRVSLRSSTHLEWTYIPLILPASRYGERVSMHYTLAWFDRYVRDQAAATSRLTATHFDASADASSIGAGTWDPVSGNNVPYKIEGRCVATHTSIYYRSTYRLNGGARQALDLRARGCAVDEDNDGVASAEDRCPGTPAGADVDANGCSAAQALADDDGDGVTNPNDACPVTPAGEMVDASGCSDSERDGDSDGVPDTDDQCPTTPVGVEVDDDGCPVATAEADYGDGILGAIAQYMARLHGVIVALASGDVAGAAEQMVAAVTEFVDTLSGLPDEVDPARPGTTLVGLNGEPDEVLAQTTDAAREVEPVILTGDRLGAWSVPAAQGAPYPYPSGAVTSGAVLDPIAENDPTELAPPGQVRDAHNGVILYPPAGATVLTGVPVDQIAAYKYENGDFVEVPVQVDEKYPYFLANANSDFSVYSGTDEELTYAWDTENWDPLTSADGCSAIFPDGQPDPVAGLDADDEIVFMASDAGAMAPPGELPEGDSVQLVRLADPLDAATERVVYLVQKDGGSSFDDAEYVNFQRNANADQWIDRTFFADNDPEKLGTSNTGYGPNLSGNVCHPTRGNQPSNDRFPRDGTVVTTDTYRWETSGRWMIRKIQIANAAYPGGYAPDLIDRWKGRAFQQSPDSNISVVGFEDEQVNWEANAGLLGERCGPVRCIREVWGADSGTNVTKTETFYRDAVTYRYRVRVHPIPPDGLYTSWDYNRGAMLPTAAEAGAGVQPGRYYTVLRPQGVPIDGVNDDVGQIDGITPVNGQCATLDGPQPPASNGLCPAFFDAADPTFNLMLAFNNWEQVSGKGDLGSMVYIFENKGPTSYANPLVVPYYRDDACLDDGTGDDPVQRPFPGESYDWNGGMVRNAYNTLAGRPLDYSGNNFADCTARQGAHGAHGVHYFVTHDTDNAFVMGKPLTEIDGQQWQFMVPTAQPTNVGDRYANVVRAPLQAVVVPLTAPVPGVGGGEREGGVMGLLGELATDFQNYLAALISGDVEGALAALQFALANLGDNLAGLVVDDPNASVASTVGGAVENPGDSAGLLASAERLINGYFSGDAGAVRAGVGVVDMTPDVGYGAGQYSDTTNIFDGLAGGEIDPYLTHKKQKASYGVQSRLTARAIVIEGNNGKRVVLLKSDNYLAQDNLLRRVGQILQANGSSIGYPQILYHVTHAHSTTYSSTLAAGVAAFQDVYDARFFESQARKLAQAILTAEANLKPARMGATTVRHKIYKGNIVRLATADDGTPAGYPLEYGDLGLVVMRFDEVDGDGDFVKPLAVWVNWGEHPESLDGHDLHSADFLAPLERFVERDLGAPLVFSQGDVGSAENSGNTSQRIADNGSVCGTRDNASACPMGQGVLRDWNHQGYVQTERNVRFLADGIVKGWKIIGGEQGVDNPLAPGQIPPNNYVPTVQVAMSSDFPVDYRNGWVPGPLSHPYPAVSNCNTEKTVQGDTGVPVAGLPDCAREGIPGENPVNDAAAMIYATAKAEGLPVPEHYDAPSALALEENVRLKLQAFRLGEVLLASCACEAQNDLILNFESRADDVANNIYNGFDWACLLPAHRNDPQYAAACQLQEEKYFNPVEFPTDVAGNAAGQGNAALIARMRAQVHNDAAGWDAPENVAFANAEPANPAEIKGNFTHEELSPARGYKLAIGIGHAGDYNGYTVSYREFMNRDSYRKALTAYGPHTADYMVTRMVRMAGAMKGGPELAPEPLDTTAQADEVRQLALTTAHGQVTKAAYDSWLAALPPDVGPAQALVQPLDIPLFNAATFRWRGGGTQIDNPVVTVERETAPNVWTTFADQTGEVQTRVHWPQGIPGVVSTYTGQFAWEWTANFEAYEAFPARLGSTPLGTYRFVANGCINDDLPGSLPRRAQGFVSAGACPGGARAYELVSEAFTVGAKVANPRSYTSASVFPFIGDNGDPRICDTCSFRPWATH